MLHVNDLTYRIAGKLLFDRATVHVPAGHRVGLVGRNGTGKTTLFRLITGELQPDGGTIRLRRNARWGTVPQEVPGGEESAIEVVLGADSERARLLADAETARSAEDISAIHNRLAEIGAHSAEARAASILAGLGLSSDDQARPCHDLSGGWRMRVALAGALFAEPDLLLLDEPTNHLDLEAAMWLSNFLQRWPRTLILISHDRDFLNRAAEEIIHLDGGKLVRYSGGYDRFERTRQEQITRDTKLRDRQMAERRRIQEFVDRFRAKATKARQAQSRLKMLARMEPIAEVVEGRTPTFTFPPIESLPPPLVAIENVAVGYAPDAPVLHKLDLRIDMDDRIGLLGANGNGKSTLIKLLAGKLRPSAGTIQASTKLRAGYFAQHQIEELDPEATGFRHVARLAPEKTEVALRAILGRFGLTQTLADVPASELSGGERTRLVLAMISLASPQLLLLDEPTNHLDMDSRQAMIQALNDYGGAVILVSHDAHLMNLVCNRLWLVADGRCVPFDGDLSDYRRRVEDQRGGGNDRQSRGAAASAAARKDPRSARRDRAQFRADTSELRKAIKVAERALDGHQREKERIEAALADPAAYTGPPTQLTGLQMRLKEVSSRIEEAERLWLDSQAALERAERDAGAGETVRR